MPETTGHLAVANDRGYLHLSCFADNPGADRGDNVIELDPGTSWEEVLAAVRRHTCKLTAATPVDEQAVDAAMAVFDRTMKLMAPHRVFVEEALAAAGQVYETAQAAEVDRLMNETEFIKFGVVEGEPRMLLKMSADLARGMVAAFDELVRQEGCEHYVEWDWTITDPATEEAIAAGVPDDQVPPLRKYKVIIVRPSGKSPHELRVEADQRLERVHTLLTHARETDDASTVEDTAKDVVNSYLALASAEENAAGQVLQLRAALRDVAAAATSAHPSAEDALRAVRERAEAALAGGGE